MIIIGNINLSEKKKEEDAFESLAENLAEILFESVDNHNQWDKVPELHKQYINQAKAVLNHPRMDEILLSKKR